MQGRNGVDQFARFTMGVALAAIVLTLSSWNKFLSLFCYYIISLSLILYIHYYGSQNNQQSFRLFLSVAADLKNVKFQIIRFISRP